MVSATCVGTGLCQNHVCFYALGQLETSTTFTVHAVRRVASPSLSVAMVLAEAKRASMRHGRGANPWPWDSGYGQAAWQPSWTGACRIEQVDVAGQTEYPVSPTTQCRRAVKIACCLSISRAGPDEHRGVVHDPEHIRVPLGGTELGDVTCMKARRDPGPDRWVLASATAGSLTRIDLVVPAVSSLSSQAPRFEPSTNGLALLAPVCLSRLWQSPISAQSRFREPRSSTHDAKRP